MVKDEVYSKSDVEYFTKESSSFMIESKTKLSLYHACSFVALLFFFFFFFIFSVT
jgi:hypothetical protein